MSEADDTSITAQAGKRPVLALIVAAAYAAAGIGFYVYSGRAEGFISPRLGFLLVALTSVPLGAYMMIALMFKLSWPTPTGRWLIIAGITVCYLLIIMGYRLDGALTEESMARGDDLVQDIEDYKAATGAYPPALADLAAGGRTLPTPALDGSSFTYAPGADGGFVLAFPSVAYLKCSRRAASADWVCDDR